MNLVGRKIVIGERYPYAGRRGRIINECLDDEYLEVSLIDKEESTYWLIDNRGISWHLIDEDGEVEVGRKVVKSDGSVHVLKRWDGTATHWNELLDKIFPEDRNKEWFLIDERGVGGEQESCLHTTPQPVQNAPTMHAIFYGPHCPGEEEASAYLALREMKKEKARLIKWGQNNLTEIGVCKVTGALLELKVVNDELCVVCPSCWKEELWT